MKPFYIQMVIAAVVVLITFGSAARAADVAYVSGGAGVDEREALLTRRRYSLKIVAARDIRRLSGGRPGRDRVGQESAVPRRRWTGRFSWPSWRRERIRSGPRPEKRLSPKPDHRGAGAAAGDFRWR